MPLYTGKWLKQHLSYMYVLACTHQILFYLDGGRKVRKQRLLVPHVDRKHQPSEKERNQRRSWEEGDWELTLFCNIRKELGELRRDQEGRGMKHQPNRSYLSSIEKGVGEKPEDLSYTLPHARATKEFCCRAQHCLVWLFYTD